MARRTRTAKKLGTRHDLNYFKRLTGTVRWRRILSIALPAIFLLWLFSSGVMGNQLPYSSGPVSKAHSVFAKQCSSCHASMIHGVKTVGFKNTATDEACLSCHQAPAHQKNQVFTPPCSSCHVEHRGTVQLTHTADSNCVSCHGNLTTTSGVLRFERTIFNFNTRHPEFASLRNHARDPGSIAFNHYIHLRSDITGPKGKVRLVCEDCHRTPADSTRTWRFAATEAQKTTSSDVPDIHRPSSGRAYMLPVTYSRTCAACHTLQFDARSSESVPHDKPEVVHAFVTEKLGGLMAGGSRNVVAMGRPIPGARSNILPESKTVSLQARIREDEQLLWRKTCKLCHAITFDRASASLPKVEASKITRIWLANAVFSHYPHQSVSCESCHRAALSSQETSDVLLPSVATCQQCHRSSGASNGAENGCFLCHQYHNWKETGPQDHHHGMDVKEVPLRAKSSD